MAYIIGVLIGIGCIALSLQILGQSLSTYVDHVALVMVLGGTISVAVATLPWRSIREFARSLFNIAFGRSVANRAVVAECLRFVNERTFNATDSFIRSSLASDILLDGSEMIALNFSTEEIDTILQERLHQYIERKKQVSSYFLRLAKYPPALGLVGTVFGLINLMRSLSSGMSPSETGIKMSLALVATLYGLLTSNFVIFPVSESLAKHVASEQFQAEIALQAVLLASDSVSLLKAQEMLNSFVSRSQRIDVIKSLMGQDAA